MLNQQTHNGTVKVIDISGEVIAYNSSNSAFIELPSSDGTPAGNGHNRALNAHQYFNSPIKDTLTNDDTNQSTQRNGTERYDLRNIDKKRSYPF